MTKPEAATEPAVGSQVERGVGRLPVAAEVQARLDVANAAMREAAAAGANQLQAMDAGIRALLPPQIPNEFGHLLKPQVLWGLYVEDGEPANVGVEAGPTGAQK